MNIFFNKIIMKKLILIMLTCLLFTNISFANSDIYKYKESFNNETNYQYVEFSESMKSQTYVIKENNKTIVVKDWVKSKEYDSIDYTFGIKYAKNSENMFFVWTKWQKKYIVKNLLEIWEYDFVNTSDKISYNNSDAKNFYLYQDNHIFIVWKNNEKYILKNSELIWPYQDIWPVELSDDFTKFTYSFKKDWSFFVKDNFNSLFWPYIEVYDILYSPNGQKLAFSFKDNSWSSVIINSSKQKYYTFENENNKLVFSPDSQDLSFIALQNSKRIFVKNWNEFNNYDYISLPNYSKSWKYFYYQARKNNKNLYVINGVESALYDSLSNIVFSPDWNNYYFEWIVNNKKDFIKNWVKLNYDVKNFQFSTNNWYSFEYINFSWKNVIEKDSITIDKYSYQWKIEYSIDQKKFNYKAINSNNEWIVVDENWKEYKNIIWWINYWKTWTWYFFIQKQNDWIYNITLNDKENIVLNNVNYDINTNIVYNNLTNNIFVFYKNNNNKFIKVYIRDTLTSNTNNTSSSPTTVKPKYTQPQVNDFYKNKAKRDAKDKLDKIINTIKYKGDSQRRIIALNKYKKNKNSATVEKINYIIDRLKE